MYFCVSGIDFASFYDFDILFWNCSDSVVFLFLLFFIILGKYIPGFVLWEF